MPQTRRLGWRRNNLVAALSLMSNSRSDLISTVIEAVTVCWRSCSFHNYERRIVSLGVVMTWLSVQFLGIGQKTLSKSACVKLMLCPYLWWELSGFLWLSIQTDLVRPSKTPSEPTNGSCCNYDCDEWGSSIHSNSIDCMTTRWMNLERAAAIDYHCFPLLTSTSSLKTVFMT